MKSPEVGRELREFARTKKAFRKFAEIGAIRVSHPCSYMFIRGFNQIVTA
jgi:hypothetical protein